MKSSVIVTVLYATLALAGPVKRALVTEWKTETLTVFVKPSDAPHLGHHRPHRVKPSTTDGASETIASSHPATASPAATSSQSADASQSTIEPSPTWAPWSNDTDYSSLSNYAAPILRQHNLHRANHSVPNLEWDDELTELAKQIADTCVYGHSNAAGDGQYGQNIGAGAPDSDVPALITNSMYNGEIILYPTYGIEPDMSNFHNWGHFSQIVWKDTQKVGCYTTKCASLENVSGNVAPYFTVCNYRPQGNFGGQYAKNVLAPLGQPSVIV